MIIPLFCYYPILHPSFAWQRHMLRNRSAGLVQALIRSSSMQTGCLQFCSTPIHAVQGRQGQPSTAPAATSSGHEHCRNRFSAHGRQHTFGQPVRFQKPGQQDYASMQPWCTAPGTSSPPASQNGTPMNDPAAAGEVMPPDEQQSGGWGQRVLTSIRSAQLLPPGLYLVATPIGNLVCACANDLLENPCSHTSCGPEVLPCPGILACQWDRLSKFECFRSRRNKCCSVNVHVHHDRRT